MQFTLPLRFKSVWNSDTGGCRTIPIRPLKESNIAILLVSKNAKIVFDFFESHNLCPFHSRSWSPIYFALFFLHGNFETWLEVGLEGFFSLKWAFLQVRFTFQLFNFVWLAHRWLDSHPTGNVVLCFGYRIEYSLLGYDLCHTQSDDDTDVRLLCCRHPWNCGL